MTTTYIIKIPVLFWVMLGIAGLASAPATAGEPAWWTQQKRDCGLPSSLAYNSWDGRCNSSPGASTPAPSYDYEAERRAREAEAERQRQQEEAERAERERQAEIKRQKDAAFIRDRDAAANSFKGSTGSAMDQLKGLSGVDNSGLKGSSFDTGGTGQKGLRGSAPVEDNRNEPVPSKPAPHTDTSVVDARVPRDGAYLVDQVPELKNSPAADRITKGFQAVVNHDWPVALAWWQDALNRDPDNVVLKRSVALAQWMVDKRKTKAAGPVSPLTAAIHSASSGDNAEAIRQFELVKKENPATAAQVDDMIAALRKRQEKDSKTAYWNQVIENDMRELRDAANERGLNLLTIGDEKGAQKAFDEASWYSAGLPADK